jgi:hypothetical protein
MNKKLVTVFDTDENFWEVNPQFKIALSFKDLYKGDKSKKRIDSSKMMWFISFVHDPNSTYYNLPLEEKEEVIGEDYMEDLTYANRHKNKLEQLIEDYVRLTHSTIDRHLKQWIISLDDRTHFLSTVKYDLDNYKDLDTMAANTPKVFDTFRKIKEEQEKEASGGGNIKGGGIESLADTGEI